jgi:hypothetical protein
MAFEPTRSLTTRLPASGVPYRSVRSCSGEEIVDRHAISQIRVATSVVVAVLALIVAAYGLYLVVIGQEITFVPAVPPGDPLPEGTTRNVPAMQGLIPAAAGLLVVIGMAIRGLLVAWIGAAIATAFAALFLFGVGGALLPVVAALGVALGINTWATTAAGTRATGGQAIG